MPRADCQADTRTRHSGKPRSTHPGRPRGGPSVVSRLGGRSAAEEKASERPARCIRRPETGRLTSLAIHAAMPVSADPARGTAETLEPRAGTTTRDRSLNETQTLTMRQFI